MGLSEILLTERKDSFYTAFSKTNGVFISGVEIAATAFANLLEDTSVKPIGTHYYILIIFAWGLLVGVVCRTAAPVLAAIGILGYGHFLSRRCAVSIQRSCAPGIPSLFPCSCRLRWGFLALCYGTILRRTKSDRISEKFLVTMFPDEVVDELAKNIVDLKRRRPNGIRGLSVHGCGGLHHVVGNNGPAGIERLHDRYHRGHLRAGKAERWAGYRPGRRFGAGDLEGGWT